MKRFLILVLVPILALAAMAGGAYWAVNRAVDPPVETIISSSLKSLHEQNRLSAFAARFVTVVTSRKAQYGLTAQKTLILPAMVHYEVDLAKLNQSDLSWDEATRTLSIRMPPVETRDPEFDLASAQDYESGQILMALTDVERTLDTANRAKAREDILKQARSDVTMKLARDASSRAIQRSFAMPLVAAGLNATVNVIAQ